MGLARGAMTNSFFDKQSERFDVDFRDIIEKCMNWHQNEDLRVSIPGIGLKFRAESNGDGPGPQNLDFLIEKTLFFWGRVSM